MGQHCSGHNDSSKKLKHSVNHTDAEVRGVIVAVDLAVTDNKKEGKDWLEKLQKENADMSEEAFMKKYHIKGNKAVMKEVKKDLIIQVVNPDLDQDEVMEEIIPALVNLVTNHEDPLLPLYFENGESCSSGGYSQRAEHLLSQIPFFRKFYKTIEENFDIKMTWCRASAEGTHSKHSDTFHRGATHRLILSINCYGKEMHFGY